MKELVNALNVALKLRKNMMLGNNWSKMHYLTETASYENFIKCVKQNGGIPFIKNIHDECLCFTIYVNDVKYFDRKFNSSYVTIEIMGNFVSVNFGDVLKDEYVSLDVREVNNFYIDPFTKTITLA